jgi:glucose/arabinose dehydrogenase
MHRGSFWAGIFFTVIFSLFSFVSTVQAAPPPNFQTTLVAGSGFTDPTGFEFAPDGRIFILQRTGEVKIYKNGQILPQNFVTLPSASTGDRGLIGIVFDPDYQTNHWVYFWYTSSDDLLNRLVRFNAFGDVATEGPVELYKTPVPSQQLHVGGGLTFGPDGRIYIGVGDNGTSTNGQDYSVPNGKILRLNKNGSVPQDNPYYGMSGYLPEIWAAGLRNPWRGGFDPQTNYLYYGDVGNTQWEEVNRIVKGGNYGWPNAEGMCDQNTTNCSAYINPLFTYNHDNQSSAVTGGLVYRGSMFPQTYQGRYFFGDYARGFIRTIGLDGNGNYVDDKDFDMNAGSVVDFKQAIDGSLYYLTYYPARLYRINYSTGNHVPIANASADVTKGVPPMTVHFSSAGSSDPDGDVLSYDWDFGDGTHSTTANPTKVYTTKGTYTVTLHVKDATNTAEAIPLVIQVGLPPSVTIGAPANGSKYRAGDTINYTAFATDGAGLDINDQGISTEVLFHHDTHIHPFLGPVIGRAGSFITPTTGEESANTWFEIKVTATDANGLSATAAVNIYPITSDFVINTNISGLFLKVDGQPHTELPETIAGVVKFQRELEAPLQQEVAGKAYGFDHWSDGGAYKHTILTQETPTSYTAFYTEIPSFSGQYFNNVTLSGSPVLTRSDPVIDFDWGGGSPDPKVTVDNFSVRWTKTQHFDAGTYTFTATSDDGVRLFVDGVKILDQWHNQGPTAYSADVTLSNANHTVVMEYYEASGGAVAKLSWDFKTPPSPTPSPTVTPSPVPTPTVAPTPAPTTPPNTVRVNVGGAYTDSAGVGWSADTGFTGGTQYTTTHAISGTTDPKLYQTERWGNPFHYKFTVPNGSYMVKLKFAEIWFTQKGQRIFDVSLNGTQVLHNFDILNEVAPFTVLDKSYPVTVTTGAITLDFSASVDDAKIASIEVVPAVSASPTIVPSPTSVPSPSPSTPPSTGGYLGEYFDTISLSGSAKVARSDADINFDWGYGSPAVGIPADNFSVRWTKTTHFAAGTYTFTMSGDDGIRLYIDNQLVLNKWFDQAATQYTVNYTLTEGDHTLRFEFYDRTEDAIAKMQYSLVGGPTPTPTTAPTPTGTPVAPTVAPTVTPVPTVTPTPRVAPTPTLAPTAVPTPTVAPSPTPVPGNVWKGEYWNTPTQGTSPTIPTTAPDLVRNDASINFEWKWMSPDPRISDDHFLVRWTKAHSFDASPYTFTVTFDDGMRVFIDGVSVFDAWGDHDSTTASFDKTMTAGSHDVRVEFYENGVWATAKVDWVKK